MVIYICVLYIYMQERNYKRNKGMKLPNIDNDNARVTTVITGLRKGSYS